MLYRPPKTRDADGNIIHPRTGPGGNTNPGGHQQRGQSVIETIRAKSAEFKAKKEAFLKPPEEKEKTEPWK